MHQLAITLKDMGVKVFGYDLHVSKYTELCEEKGIRVEHKFNKEICNVDLCVKTGAVKDKKYLNFLNKNQAPIIDRADLLGWICKKFKCVIAVAGTHGKTTTSSLIYHILKTANKKVSCHIGGEVKDYRFNINDDYLVVEACEYNKSFLKLKPTISVVTNIEREHMDSYGTFFNLRSSFLNFLRRGDKRFVFVDKSTNFLRKYNNINFINNHNLEINPQIKGEHNMKNISVAVAVCRDLSIDDKTIIEAINSFEGVKRRYEFIGKYQNNKVYIDYAHHPTEVKAFIETFNKENVNSQIIFQPHTYSRTKTFLKEFVSIFSKVDNLVIYKEYSAREKRTCGLSAKQLYTEIKKVNNTVKYAKDINSIIKNLETNCSLAFVGAGDINQVAESLVKTLNENNYK